MRRPGRSLVLLLAVAGLTAFTSPKTGCGTFAQTRYPIVLAHGAAGFDSLLGVLDYWFGIPEDLANGGAKVFVTQVNPFDTSEARGEELIAELDQIRAVSGQRKFNLIGHSQGGLDVRYVAAVRPDLVASVTTVGSPHLGSDVADYLSANFVNGSFTQNVIADFGNALGTVIGLLSGSSDPPDVLAALHDLTSAGAATFNASYPQGLPATPCGTEIGRASCRERV